MTRRRALHIALRRLTLVAIGATTIVTCGSTATSRPQGGITLLPNPGPSVSTARYQTLPALPLARPCYVEGGHPGC